MTVNEFGLIAGEAANTESDNDNNNDNNEEINIYYAVLILGTYDQKRLEEIFYDSASSNYLPIDYRSK